MARNWYNCMKASHQLEFSQSRDEGTPRKQETKANSSTTTKFPLLKEGTKAKALRDEKRVWPLTKHHSNNPYSSQSDPVLHSRDNYPCPPDTHPSPSSPAAYHRHNRPDPHSHMNYLGTYEVTRTNAQPHALPSCPDRTPAYLRQAWRRGERCSHR